MIGIKDQCFGVEIELTGITRAEAAEALAAYFETTPQRSYDNYDTITTATRSHSPARSDCNTSRRIASARSAHTKAADRGAAATRHEIIRTEANSQPQIQSSTWHNLL